MDQKDISKTLMLSSFVIRFSMHIGVDLISVHILRDTSSFHIAEEGGEGGVESEEGGGVLFIKIYISNDRGGIHNCIFTCF